jgi:hypothetical protein
VYEGSFEVAVFGSFHGQLLRITDRGRRHQPDRSRNDVIVNDQPSAHCVRSMLRWRHRLHC